MRGPILVNPSSGNEETSLAALARRFPAAQVEECPPERLVGRVRAALDESWDFIGIAGGDGTIRSAVQELAGRELPLLPVPGGTRNHFARDLGLVDLDAAASAAETGVIRTIDVGWVNDRCFVNNSSIGLYPKIVVRREAYERRMPKSFATIVAASQQLRRNDRITVTVDGRRHDAWMVFVGNGRYGEGVLDLADRESIDDNVLDVRIARADRPFARLRVLAALLLGRLASAQAIEQFTCTSTTLQLGRAEVEVALDGEVETLAPPLAYTSSAASLRILVPSGRP